MCSLCVLVLWQITPVEYFINGFCVLCCSDNRKEAVLGQVLRTDICGSRYCISMKYDFFFIILNCIVYCVF